ncbi:MAG TPA: hypothetical protein VND64_24995 [Pirellulales bacterium]|nr:hypothetical protein [Pirellulales bacterium]
MPFQFYCPQGHLLEGHESQMGQQNQCPLCGMVFVVPVMQQQAPAAPAGWMPGYGQPGVAPEYPGGMPGGMGYQGGVPGGVGYPGMVPGAPGYPGVQAGYPPAGVFPGGAAYPGMAPGFAPAPAEPGFPGVVTGPTIEAPQIHPEPQQTSEPPTQAAEPAPEKQEPRIVRIPCPHGHELQTPMDMIGQDVLCPFCNTQFHLKYENSVEYKDEQAELKQRREEQLNQTALKWAIIAAVVVVVGILAMIVYQVVTAPAEETTAPPAASEPSDEEPAAPARETPAADA